MSEPLKLPLRVESSLFNGRYAVVDYFDARDADGKLVARCTDEAQANQIVNAVNSHDELTAKLAAAVEALKEFANEDNWDRHYYDHEDESRVAWSYPWQHVLPFEIAQAALKKARPENE